VRPGWKLDNVAVWCERLLGIPAGSIQFQRPHGKPIKPNNEVHDVIRIR
jgi:hypothetical protein